MPIPENAERTAAIEVEKQVDACYSKLVETPLGVLADELDNMPRSGVAVDVPEGARTVTVSDTLLRALARRLRVEACD